MELKSVEIIGFKSFADRMVFTFDGGITAIVGPNGSGKSNISDAIRWVLGEQSAKQLRGAKMEDVIFAGTQRRKPLGYAKVILTLANTDRGLPVDYDEVSISRCMYRSGESEYLLNGTKCRLKDIQELLMDTGIGKEGYSIIGQGRIDQLLSNKPQDRRLLFEEASGMVKYKTRRDEANKNLQEEQTNLQRVLDVLGEASARLEPLEKQAADAKEYLAMADELKTLELQFFLRQYENLMNQNGDSIRNLENSSQQLETLRSHLNAAKEQSSILSEAVQKATHEAADQLSKVNELRVLRENQLGQQHLSAQELNNLYKNSEDARIHLEDVVKRRQHRQDTFEKEKQQILQYEQGLEKQRSQLQEATQKKEQGTQEYQALLTRMDTLGNEQEQQRQKVENLRENLTRQATLREQGSGQLDEYSERLKSLRMEAQNQKEHYELLKAQLEETENAYALHDAAVLRLTDQVTGLRNQQNSCQDALSAVQKEKEKAQSRLEWINELEKEYEGYSASVKLLMQLCSSRPDLYPGVYKTVADLMEVPGKYATAMEIALGGAVQNIVTDTTATAKVLIDYLHQKKAGRATFLPLSEVTGRSREYGNVPLGMPGIIGYANDLITYEPKYQPIFSRLLGNCLVADSYEHAAAASARYGKGLRVVTLRGDIFNIGGSITGGSSGNSRQTIVNRKGEKEDLTELLKKLSLEVEKKQQESVRAQVARQQLNEQINQEATARDEAARKRDQVRSEHDQALILMNVAWERLSEEEKNSEYASQLLQSDEQNVLQLEQELAEKQKEFETLSERITALKQTREQMRTDNENYRSEEMRLRIEVSTSQQLIASMERSLEHEKAEEEQDQALEADYRVKLEEMLQQINRLENASGHYEAQLGELVSRIESGTMLHEEMQVKQVELEAKQSAAAQEVERLSRETTELEKEVVRLESQNERAKNELTGIQDRIWEKYELTLHAVQEMHLPPLEGIGKNQRRMEEIRGRIRKMGPVNVNAVEEYNALKERCTFLQTQIDDIRSSEKSLLEMIDQLNQRMEEQFREGFGKISEQFNLVFQKMFGGGYAKLVLEEESEPLESGIEIIAQPPGKNVKNMAALSGGERALTAIAILFAIQQLKPAPFCILDEIEAALDDANVNRFANFLKTLCTTTQFIVITHRKGTMEAAETMYGITMEEKGVSKCISVKFE